MRTKDGGGLDESEELGRRLGPWTKTSLHWKAIFVLKIEITGA